MEREVAQIKSRYPEATYVGIADGAKDNWLFLEQLSRQKFFFKNICLEGKRQNIDFYHATGYLKAAAYAAYPRSTTKRSKWITERCHSLKHETNFAIQILEEMKTFRSKNLSNKINEDLESSITYFNNHFNKMNYAQSITEHILIDFEVKVFVKQKL